MADKPDMDWMQIDGVWCPYPVTLRKEHEREKKVWEQKFCEAALELDALNQNTGRLRVRLEQTERELADTQQKFQPLLRQVEILRAERDRSRSLLRRAEWVEGYDSQDFYVQQCPICGADKHDGHHTGCELDAELKEHTDA